MKLTVKCNKTAFCEKGFHLNDFFFPSFFFPDERECFGITSSVTLKHENHNHNNLGQLMADVNEANQTP